MMNNWRPETGEEVMCEGDRWEYVQTNPDGLAVIRRPGMGETPTRHVPRRALKPATSRSPHPIRRNKAP